MLNCGCYNSMSGIMVNPATNTPFFVSGPLAPVTPPVPGLSGFVLYSVTPNLQLGTSFPIQFPTTVNGSTTLTGVGFLLLNSGTQGTLLATWTRLLSFIFFPNPPTDLTAYDIASQTMTTLTQDFTLDTGLAVPELASPDGSSIYAQRFGVYGIGPDQHSGTLLPVDLSRFESTPGSTQPFTWESTFPMDNQPTQVTPPLALDDRYVFFGQVSIKVNVPYPYSVQTSSPFYLYRADRTNLQPVGFERIIVDNNPSSAYSAPLVGLFDRVVHLATHVDQQIIELQTGSRRRKAYSCGVRRGKMRAAFSSMLRQGLLCGLVFGSVGLAATPAPTVTTLSLSSSSVAAGTVVTLTASVTAGANPVTSGSVLFMDGNRALGSAQVVISGMTAGSATIKTASFAPGSNTITAIYSGAPNAAEPTAPSSSAPATLTGTGILASALSLSAAGAPGHVGNYDLTGTLFGFGLASLNGTVSFSETLGNTLLGTAPVGASTYSFAPVQSYNGTSAMNPGPAAVLADFNSDGFLDVAVGSALFFGDPTHPGRFVLSSSITAGIALAVGDFNSDGIPDLIILQGRPGTLGVLLGDPNHPGQFLAGAGFTTTGGSPAAAAVGDFNGDGVLDLVALVPHFGSIGPSADVFLGDPAHPGQFLAPAAYNVPVDPFFASLTDVAIGDFNGDGLPDLAVTTASNIHPGYPQDTVSVLLNDPAHPGQFLPGTTYAAGYSPSSVAVGDFNGDGILDLAVANFGDTSVPPPSPEISILFGDPIHPGQFLPQTPVDIGEYATSVTVADFNHDGVLDLAVASISSNNVGVVFGNPANPGTFLAAQFFPIGPVTPANSTGPEFSTGPVFVAAADVNGDVLPDLITANLGATPAMSVFLDSQTATAQLQNVSPGAPGQYFLTAGYSGNSGFAASATPQPLSVVVPHPTTTTLVANPYTGALGTAFTLTATVTVKGNPVTAGSVQFSDGKRVLGTAQVIISGPSAGTAVLKTASFGTGLQSLTAVYSGAPQSAQSTAPSTSAPEVITVTGVSPTTTDLSILPSILLPGTYDITATLLAAGSDIGHGTLSVNEISTATSLGNESVATTGGFLPPQVTLSNNQYQQILALADLNGDGIPDLIQSTDSSLTVQFGDPSHPGQFLPAANYHLTGSALYIVVGDVKGDGLPDVLVLANQSSGESISLFLNNPMQPGQLEPEQVIIDLLNPANGLFLADLNADGGLDIAVSSGYNVTVFFGNPANPGHFLAPQNLNLGLDSEGSVLGVADFNQDGFNDLALYTGATTYIFFGDPVHPGQFTPGGQYPQIVNQLIGIGDFNGDGLPDIVGDSVLLLNNPANPGVFSSVPSNAVSALNGVPSDVTFLAGLNSDGVSDLVALSPGMLQCDGQNCWTSPATATILLSDPAGPGQFIVSGIYPLGSFNLSGVVATADINGDGQPDFIAGFIAPNGGEAGGYHYGLIEMLGNQTANLTLENVLVPGGGISSVGAAYSGDVHYQPSSSATALIETSAAVTTTQLTALSTNVATGSQVTLDALVQSGTLIPPALVSSGSVAFYDGASVLCTVTVNAFGQATCSTTLTGLGAHSIYAAYSPTVAYASSVSSALAIVVTGATGTATLTATPNPIPIPFEPLYGTTTIRWSAPTAQSVEVHVGSPTGTLFAGGGSTGSAMTGAWVTDGLPFYLQDTTGGKPLTAANTLAVVVVQLQQQLLMSASPNPIPVPPGSVLGMTTIQWNAPSAQSVEVHVNSPTGPLFAAGESVGSALTGEWVTDGMTFYLQDVSGGKPLTSANTLWTVVVHLQQQLAVFTANPNPIPTPPVGTTTLNWNAPTATTVEIHVGSPTGTLFAGGGSAGSAATGDWVTDGIVFYLQDVSGGKPLTPANTLAQLVVHVAQTAYFSASSNPISDWVVVNGIEVGSTTLQWNLPTVIPVEIHVDSPSGPLLTTSGVPGSVQTGLIATDGRAFYLQYAGYGVATSPSNTLAMLITHLAKQATPFLTASPNPVNSYGAGVAATTLQWSAPNSGTVQIRVGAPDGPLFARGGSTGTAVTGYWVTNGELFYLQDVTGGKPLTAANTLAVLIVTLNN